MMMPSIGAMAAGPAGIATEGAVKILTNKWFWIIILVIILLIIFRRKWNKISGLIARDFGNYAEGEKLTSERKRQIEGICDTLSKEVNATCLSQAWGESCVNTDTLKQLNAMDDNELKYAAKYYKKALSRGTSMYTDVDDESLYNTDEDENLLTGLSKIGEQS